MRTVLQLIAEESNLNIVASDTVQGNVTLRLVNVPWDQALDIVLQAKGLDKRRNGGVVWVAPQPEIAKFEQDKEDARIAIDKRADLVTEYVQINYHNAAAIYKALTEAKGIGGGSGGGGGGSSQTRRHGFLSPRGRLVADERTNTLMISDIPKKVAQMRELIGVIDRPVDQVLIEARIVIATDTFARELGAQVRHQGVDNVIQRQPSNWSTQFTGRPRSAASADSRYNWRRGSRWPQRAICLPAASPNWRARQLGLYLRWASNFNPGRWNSPRCRKKAVAKSSPTRASSPANQREAVDPPGQGNRLRDDHRRRRWRRRPRPTCSSRKSLLELKVTPTITNDGRVFLNLDVKKDEVEGYIDWPAMARCRQISKREINTAVLVEDGQTVVIGGVYEFTDRSDVAKVPFLGDIPFLGNLFKKKGRTKNKAELLIFVTPEGAARRASADRRWFVTARHGAA